MLPFNPAKMFEDRRIVEYEEEETNFYYYPKGHGNEGQVRCQPPRERALLLLWILLTCTCAAVGRHDQDGHQVQGNADAALQDELVRSLPACSSCNAT